MRNSKPKQRDTGTRLGTALRRRPFPREAMEMETSARRLALTFILTKEDCL